MTVGRFLAIAGQVPERVLVSPTVRAQQTLGLGIDAGRWDCEVSTREELYGGGDDVLGAVHRYGADAELLMIFGDQPTWSATASRLRNRAEYRLPTASTLRLDVGVSDWVAVGGEGRAEWLVTPRLLAKRPQVRAGGTCRQAT
jgi:phosphohistidine phosphatase SixA